MINLCLIHTRYYSVPRLHIYAPCTVTVVTSYHRNHTSLVSLTLLYLVIHSNNNNNNIDYKDSNPIFISFLFLTPIL